MDVSNCEDWGWVSTEAGIVCAVCGVLTFDGEAWAVAGVLARDPLFDSEESPLNIFSTQISFNSENINRVKKGF